MSRLKGCKKAYTRLGNRQLYCDACITNRCTKCGRIGAHAPTCPRAGKVPAARKATGGGKRSRKPKPAKAHAFMHNAATDNARGSIAARIQGLVQAVVAGKSAQAELDAIRKVMAGA